MQNQSIVSPSFIKQIAKQLKRDKLLSQSDALNTAVMQFGFTNYKNYLNVLKKNLHAENAKKEAHFNNIFSEAEIIKKMDLVISFIKTFPISFQEQLDLLKLFENTKNRNVALKKLTLDPDLHEFIEQPYVQFVCEKLNFVHNELEAHLFNDFLTSDGRAEIHFRQPHFIAKKIAIINLTYELVLDTLHIEGEYTLKTEFEFELDKTDPISNDQRFNDRELFGSFGIEIDSNKKILITHSDIGEDINGSIDHLASFR